MSAADIARVLATVYDPELGVDIVSLGLVYGIEDEPGHVAVRMTTTFDACPMGAAIQEAVRRTLALARPASFVEIEVTHDPPWDPAMLAPAARKLLGLAP
jgi:metal-sulfur cluster biosynthetic enzyme